MAGAAAHLMSIPIRNLYYLFCYAWERFPEGEQVDAGVDECPDVLNLFGRLLVNGLNRLLRRGLDRGYRPFVEETRAPRGRMVLDEIIKTQSLRRGAVICAYDELTVDVLHNQLLKGTALQLAGAAGVERKLAHELRLAAKRMEGVSAIRPTAPMFSRVQLSRNTGQYAPLLRLCEILVRKRMPDQEGSETRFASIVGDEVLMSTVFEEFLRNFYRIEQTRFRSVAAETLKWDGYAVTEVSRPHLPNMITDITLRSSERVVVVDAKFHKDVLTSGYGADKAKSANLYQMLAYLQHTAQTTTAPVDGILLYPVTSQHLHLHYYLLGHHVQIATIDLTMPWPAIHARLIELLRDPASMLDTALVA